MTNPDPDISGMLLVVGPLPFYLPLALILLIILHVRILPYQVNVRGGGLFGFGFWFGSISNLPQVNL